MGTADYSIFEDYRNQTGTTSRQPSGRGFTGEYFTPETGLLHLRARDLNPNLGRFLSTDPVQPNAPGTQGYNPYAYVANNPTTWIDPSGFSAQRDPLTPGQASILVALMVSVPAAVVLGGIGVSLLMFGLILTCALDENCRPEWQDAVGFIKELGSDGINTVQWTAETLNTAFATYPLLPENSPALQVMANIGLSAVGLDTITDFAALISGRDPLTGRALTPRDMFITWLAFMVPFVPGGAARSLVNESVSGLTPNLQNAIVRSIRESGDDGLLLAFRGRAPGSYIWDSWVPQKPQGAENLWKGHCGLRFCEVPTPEGGKTWGYYVSDLDAAWAVSGKGQRIKDEELFVPSDGIYQSINTHYGVDVIQHGAHLNAVLDGIGGRPLGPEKYGILFRYVTDPYDPVFIFSANGLVGSGLLGPTYVDAIKGRLIP